jgi:hypothetical protein
MAHKASTIPLRFFIIISLVLAHLNMLRRSRASLNHWPLVAAMVLQSTTNKRHLF